MKKIFVLASIVFISMSLQAKDQAAKKLNRKTASAHKCEADALNRATKLLRLHVLGSSEKTSEYLSVENIDVPEASIDAAATGVDVLVATGRDGNAQYTIKLSYLSGTACQLVSLELIDRKR